MSAWRRTGFGVFHGRQLHACCHSGVFWLPPPMLAFILRRLLQAVIVLVTVALISFMLFQFVGDPVVIMLGQDATPDQINALRAALGLDQSFIVQFWRFLANAAQGEFGLSLRQGAQVSALIAERFPATLELSRIGVDMKVLIEQMREQVQNIE